MMDGAGKVNSARSSSDDFEAAPSSRGIAIGAAATEEAKRTTMAPTKVW